MDATTDTMAGNGESWLGLAMLGKTAFALLVIVAVILLCAWLLRRLGALPGQGGREVKIVGSRTLGPKERLVVVEVEGVWLVLGIGGGNISKLHELPAPQRPGPVPDVVDDNEDYSFAARFARALSDNSRRALKRDATPPRSQS